MLHNKKAQDFLILCFCLVVTSLNSLNRFNPSDAPHPCQERPSRAKAINHKTGYKRVLSWKMLWFFGKNLFKNAERGEKPKISSLTARRWLCMCRKLVAIGCLALKDWKMRWIGWIVNVICLGNVYGNWHCQLNNHFIPFENWTKLNMIFAILISFLKNKKQLKSKFLSQFMAVGREVCPPAANCCRIYVGTWTPSPSSPFCLMRWCVMSCSLAVLHWGQHPTTFHGSICCCGLVRSQIQSSEIRKNVHVGQKIA